MSLLRLDSVASQQLLGQRLDSVASQQPPPAPSHCLQSLENQDISFYVL